MSNQEHKFKDRDIKRVVKAARAAGLDVGCVEVNPRTGAITAIARQAYESAAHAEGRASAGDTPEAIISQL